MQALTREGEVQPAVEGHVRRVSVLSGAHELGVLDGRLGDRGGRRLLAHHADPVFRPRFLSDAHPRSEHSREHVAALQRCTTNTRQTFTGALQVRGGAKTTREPEPAGENDAQSVEGENK